MEVVKSKFWQSIISLSKGTVLVVWVMICMASSCKKNEVGEPVKNDLEILPADTGGVQVAVYYNTGEEYGYYAYTPSGYETNGQQYPLLIFLHGSGEKGNSMTDTVNLKKVLVHGPPMMIGKKQWKPKYPMIVVSPQCHEGWWNEQKLHRFMKQLQVKYRVNSKRIYLTGLSMGGFGTFSYLQTCADSSFVAAAVPICGGGTPSKAAKLVNVPLWAFHGDADPTVDVSKSKDMIEAINKLNPSLRAKLTLYPGVGHNSWTKTYDGTGMGTESKDYDAFNESIYDWMFRYSK